MRQSENRGVPNGQLVFLLRHAGLTPVVCDGSVKTGVRQAPKAFAFPFGQVVNVFGTMSQRNFPVSHSWLGYSSAAENVGRFGTTIGITTPSFPSREHTCSPVFVPSPSHVRRMGSKS